MTAETLIASLQLSMPELILAVGAMALLMIGVFSGERATPTVTGLAVAVLIIAGLWLVLKTGEGEAYGGAFLSDPFAKFMKVLALIGSITVMVMTVGHARSAQIDRFEFPVLLVLATLGMLLMISANDLISLYLSLELQSLALYVVAAINRDSVRSTEAGLKYFVLGALSSGMLLYGASLVYGFTGTVSFPTIATALQGPVSGGVIFGLVFIAAGIAFKISAVPFHMWTPDVYEGSPTPVTLFFASAPKVAAVALLARVAMDAFGNQADAWRQIVIVAALASIVVGALGAIGQANIKRFLAYSSINNVGFILIGLATGTAAGASAMLIYLAIYVPMTVGSFVAVLMLKDEIGEPIEAIADMAGLSRTRPALAWCLMALMFSLAGIPPLFGFWGKFVVFQAAVQADLVALAFLGMAASVIGAFYYIKIVKIMFFDEPADTIRGRSDWAHWALLTICAVLMSPLGYLLTGVLDTFADGAAAALFLVA